MDRVIYRDYILNRHFFLFTVVWPASARKRGAMAEGACGR